MWKLNKPRTEKDIVKTVFWGAHHEKSAVGLGIADTLANGYQR